MISKRKQLFAAIASTGIAAILLSGCSNPYNPPSAPPATAPKEEASPSASPDANELNPPEAQPDPEASEEPVVDEEEMRERSEFFGIDPDSVELPQEVKDEFGDEADTVARDALYSTWLPSTLSTYQVEEVKEGSDTDLLERSLQEFFLGDAYENFVKAMDDDHPLAFHLYPFWSEHLDIDVDTSRSWTTQIRNFEVTNFFAASDGELNVDGAVVEFERRVNIPLTNGKVNQIDSSIALTMVPDGEGRWRIGAWKYYIDNNATITPEEVEQG